MIKTDLSKFDNSWYKPGRNVLIRTLWYITNLLIMRNRFLPFSFSRTFFLRLFGARVGKGVVIKPGVTVKYPWRLQIGDFCWIGEGVWIDNLDNVVLGNNVCISQGAMLLCGNHNYRKPSFDLIVGQIILDEGAWIGAKAVVGPGVKVGSHAVLSVGSVASGDLEGWKIYRGNPAIAVRDRSFDNED